MSLTYKIRECPPERTRIMTNEEVTPNPLWNEKTTQWGLALWSVKTTPWGPISLGPNKFIP